MITRKSQKNKKLNIVFWDDRAEDTKKMLFTEIKLGLEEYGWKPHIFTDKELAVAFVLNNDVAAVVLDLKENGKPVGLDILEYLRKERPFLPIVMFTIYAEIEHVLSALQGQASYYVISPIKGYLEMVQAIEIAIDREKAKESIIHERSLASIGKFAAGVAHFIKNSLYNIQSRAQILLEKTDQKDEAYQFLEVINRRCSDANKVVVDLLDFASGKTKRSGLEDVHVVDCIDEVLGLLSTDIKHHAIEIEKIIEPGVIKIRGSAFDLKEAFLNLIKNAVEAMPHGGNLKITVRATEDHISIEISDTGTGMSEETLDSIFIPFYTTKGTSSGMGLFITKQIIQNNKGEITAAGKLGEGSTFTVTFPKTGS